MVERRGLQTVPPCIGGWWARLALEKKERTDAPGGGWGIARQSATTGDVSNARKSVRPLSGFAGHDLVRAAHHAGLGARLDERQPFPRDAVPGGAIASGDGAIRKLLGVVGLSPIIGFVFTRVKRHFVGAPMH